MMFLRFPHFFGLTLLAILGPSLVAPAATIPAPVVISPSQYWEGNDGPWSTFTLQVGTPAQNVRTVISTAGTATWVVLPEGCTPDDPADCGTRRGVAYNINGSSTWTFNNFYGLLLETNLGYSGSGEFGFDRVGIDWQGSGGPILDNQIVAGIATQEFWLGSFGLNPRPTNFSNFNDPQPSFMQTLKNKSMIPSLSWSYTAGAPYRYEKVPGSLVFGGYDLAKSGTTNLTFAMGPDISRDLTVGLQAITTTISETETELLPQAIYTFIDSTVPHIWLPVAACEAFEKAFNLTWNSTIELYLLDDALHDSLVKQNATFTFKIGNTTTEPPSLDISLPYASFDLTVDYPIVNQPTKYFPIRRAENDTQYTLGRTFLQEAYLTADYERSKFYLSQTIFNTSAKEHIITIQSIDLVTKQSKHHLSTGAITGIAVGIPLGLLLIGGLILSSFIKRRREKKAVAEAETLPTYPIENKAELDAKDTTSPGEIGVSPNDYFVKPAVTEAHEMETGTGEIRPLYEMEGDAAIRQEMDAGHRGGELSDH